MDSGECKCIDGASRKDGAHSRCTCDEPSDAAREAFFELIPKKRCRSRCKEGTREVFGEMSSTCMNTDTYRAVMLAAIAGDGSVTKGACDEGKLEIPTDGGAATECIAEEFVNDIISF